MTVSEKIKTINNKIKQKNVNTLVSNNAGNILIMLVNMNLCQANLFYWKETCRKKLLESKDLNIRH